MKAASPQLTAQSTAPAAWYWPATSKLKASTEMLSGQLDADIIVIGAGYTGLSCALHCAEGGLSTVLLESNEPGAGGSGRNAGQWLPGWASKSPDDVLRIFGEESGSKVNGFMPEAISLLQNLVKTAEPAIDFRRCGVLQVAKKQSQLDKLFAAAEQWSRYGLEVEQLDQYAVKDFVLTDAYSGGIRFCQAGTLNPYAYSQHLANSAEQAGVDLYCHSPVTGLSQDGAGWRADTESGTVRARSAIIATNAYTSAELWPGLEKSYYRLPLPMLTSAPLSDQGASFLPQRTPFAEMTAAGLFGGMLTPDNRWLASTLPLRSDDADIDAIGHWALSRFRKTFPEAEQFTWDQLWWGNIALTGDGLPKMVKLADNLYTAFGYSGAGIVLATGLGRELAKIILTGDEREALFPVSPLKSVAMPDFVPWIARKLLIPGLRQIEKMSA